MSTTEKNKTAKGKTETSVHKALYNKVHLYCHNYNVQRAITEGEDLKPILNIEEATELYNSIMETKKGEIYYNRYSERLRLFYSHMYFLSSKIGVFEAEYWKYIALHTFKESVPKGDQADSPLVKSNVVLLDEIKTLSYQTLMEAYMDAAVYSDALKRWVKRRIYDPFLLRKFKRVDKYFRSGDWYFPIINGRGESTMFNAVSIDPPLSKVTLCFMKMTDKAEIDPTDYFQMMEEDIPTEEYIKTMIAKN